MSKRRASNGNAALHSQKKHAAALDLIEDGSDLENSSAMSDVVSTFNTDMDSSAVWSSTLKTVIKGVVSIHFSNITNFDTECCLTSEATGFVVDAQRGIILTNRHVVGPGPFSGYAVFDNHEEAVVVPIYRDPIHDFGFLRFEPSDIKYMQISQLDLRPDLAQVGTEIRVVGNDAGEKLSILAGIISRLDRNAPYYGDMSYNDFNTEYIQAAASASGGSSGSPVINEEGHAVALQAGGSTEAATDFFLPVWRPLRALRCIQKSEPITRGDIQVEWMLRPFEECRRLGLTPEAESTARSLFPDKSGLLVVEMVLPEGPADGLIKEGDTLISIDGKPIATFVQVDEILDSSVGKLLEFVIQRGGHELVQSIVVGDLHAITPNRYVEVSGSLFNNLSYQLARSYGIPVKGVYASDAGGTFLGLGDDNLCIVDMIDDKPTPDLDTFVEVVKNIPDRRLVSVTYHLLTDMHDENIMLAHMDRHWSSSFRQATRNDTTGLWDFTTLQKLPLPPVQPKPVFARFVDIPIASEKRKACASIPKSFVRVCCEMPVPVDNYPWTSDVGFGLVVDAAHGYVLVSRKVVPHDVCDVYLIFAESVDIPAEVVFLHPNLNYAIVKYDPSLVTADVQSPKFSTKALKRGDHAFFVGTNFRFNVVTDDVIVSSVRSIIMSPNYSSPRYRGTCLECVEIDSKTAQECDGGVLLDDDGTVRAFWLAFLGDQSNDESHNIFRLALDATDVLDVIELLKKDQIPSHLRIMEATLGSISVYLSRVRGVPQDWLTKFENECPDEVRLQSVFKVGAPRFGELPCPLKFADIILTVNDKLATSTRDLDPYYRKELRLKIVREKKVMDIVVPTVDTSSVNTSRLLQWCGSLIQTPHLAVRQLMVRIPSEVYITRKSRGGPTAQYGINTGVFVTHVNDQETPDLDAFIKVTDTIADNTYVKLRLVSFNDVPGAVSLKTNYHYFPTSEMWKDTDGKWKKVDRTKKQ